MSTRALVGLGAMNSLVLVSGLGALLAIRGARSWLELARLAGLAYMLGVAVLGVLLSIELVVGIPFSLPTFVVTAFLVAAGGVVLARVLGRPLPTVGDGHAGATFGIASGIGLALVVVYAEALFRAARLQALSAWDAWAFWVPKAKAIYFFGELDEQFFRELANPAYPPLLPALEASAFHFMGSADVVTLHVQMWFFLVGFVFAAYGILSPRVSPLLLWPFLLLVLVAPRVVDRTLEPQADFLLDYFFALAALLVVLWLVERSPWLLVAAIPFLGAAMLTKREGQLFAACVLVSGLVVSVRDYRFAWPRLAAAGAVALVLAVPWRIWFTTHGLTGELPTEGFLGVVRHLDRAWPSLTSVSSAALDFELWLLVLPFAALATMLAVLSGARLVPAYTALVYTLALSGFVWVLWSSTELELPFVQDEGVNPVVRLTGSLVILSVVLTPILLEQAWSGTSKRRTDGG